MYRRFPLSREIQLKVKKKSSTCSKQRHFLLQSVVVEDNAISHRKQSINHHIPLEYNL